MYTPPIFIEHDPKVIRAIVDHFPLSTVFVAQDGVMSATHLPLLVDVVQHDAAVSYTLTGHVANQNELVQQMGQGAEVLVVYRAEDSYISPNWYPTKQTHHQHVPTWNYQAVHFYGKIELIREPKFILGVLGRLTRQHEQRVGEAKPWVMSDAPREYMDQLLTEITGIRIRVDRVVATSKLSQNREPIDFASVKQKMAEQGKRFMDQMMNQDV
jgi:transcriptional regulator